MVTYNRPNKRRNRVPPEEDDPFYAEDHQESEYPVVPPPEPTVYMIFKDERKDVRERPEGTCRREIPKQDSKSEQKERGLLRKLR